MYFANGDVKEGYFENGVFKMDGDEQSIKHYMKVNGIPSASDPGS